jgi:hypothetical protein
MLALPTAKTLLFLALSMGPHQASTIYATSNSEGYVWTPTQTGWSLVGLGFPSSDFTRDPSKSMTFTGDPAAAPRYLRAVAHHDWSRRNSAMVFDNGDRVEKHGDHAFYIINAGGPNEKVFTILFPKE